VQSNVDNGRGLESIQYKAPYTLQLLELLAYGEKHNRRVGSDRGNGGIPVSFLGAASVVELKEVKEEN